MWPSKLKAAKKYFHVLLFIMLQQGGIYVKEILSEQNLIKNTCTI